MMLVAAHFGRNAVTRLQECAERLRSGLDLEIVQCIKLQVITYFAYINGHPGSDMLSSPVAKGKHI